MTINFWNWDAIEDSTYGFETITSLVEFKLNGTEAWSYPKQVETAGMAVFFITLLTPIIGVISMIFGLSFGIAFDFITAMQLFSLFPLAKLYMPT